LLLEKLKRDSRRRVLFDIRQLEKIVQRFENYKLDVWVCCQKRRECFDLFLNGGASVRAVCDVKNRILLAVVA